MVGIGSTLEQTRLVLFLCSELRPQFSHQQNGSADYGPPVSWCLGESLSEVVSAHWQLLSPP